MAFVSLIESFNRRQTGKAVIAAVASVIALVVTIAFFYYGPLLVMANLDIENRRSYAFLISITTTLVIIVVGWRGRPKVAGTTASRIPECM